MFVVHQGAASETCQDRYIDRVSKSELGKFSSKQEGISTIYPKVRIDFGQFRPESNDASRSLMFRAMFF